jgi:hypothetical protein
LGPKWRQKRILDEQKRESTSTTTNDRPSPDCWRMHAMWPCTPFNPGKASYCSCTCRGAVGPPRAADRHGPDLLFGLALLQLSTIDGHFGCLTQRNAEEAKWFVPDCICGYVPYHLHAHRSQLGEGGWWSPESFVQGRSVQTIDVAPVAVFLDYVLLCFFQPVHRQ